MSTVAADQQYALEVEDLETGYLGNPVVFGLSLRLAPGRITALFGPNGAGKTSTLKAIAGLNPIYEGTVRFRGEDITKEPTSRRVGRGLVYLPQEHATFTTMTVRDNLILGATLVNDSAVVAERLDHVTTLFPILGRRLTQLAGTMSGGEQRMLSMGIALMAGAKALLLDEPSLGLAPLVNQTLLNTAKQLAEEAGLAVLLVEQAIGQALEYADHVYVMRSGEMLASYTREEAQARDDGWEMF